MNLNVKRDLIAHLTVEVSYSKLMSGKYTPLRRKDKKSEIMITKQQRERVECNKDQIRTWKDVQIMSLSLSQCQRRLDWTRTHLHHNPLQYVAVF